MRLCYFYSIFILITALAPAACVYPIDEVLRSHLNVIVVDATITNLAEAQIIHLGRSKSDSLSGLPGYTPISKAVVEVVVDSTQIIACHETVDGSYQLPSDFKGQIGHAYQLRFTLTDGSHYKSSQQVMLPVVAISTVRSQFNPVSISPSFAGNYTAGHDFFIDFQDPILEHNYYRWDWKLWEKQDWCRSCPQSLYLVWNYDDTQLVEDCGPPSELIPDAPYFVNDYPCRTQCWEIIYSSSLNIFDDRFVNGQLVTKRNIGQIPYFDPNPCLVEIRQSSLTPDAYSYFKRFAEQTQNTGGLADTPPSAPVGNIQNTLNTSNIVVGYFTASAVATVRYWLDRKDARGSYPGLFQALNGRDPSPEGSPYEGHPKPLQFIPVSKFYTRPPTAVCAPSDTRTPQMPNGWQN